jgi:hypothetical protein
MALSDPVVVETQQTVSVCPLPESAGANWLSKNCPNLDIVF